MKRTEDTIARLPFFLPVIIPGGRAMSIVINGKTHPEIRLPCTLHQYPAFTLRNTSSLINLPAGKVCTLVGKLQQVVGK